MEVSFSLPSLGVECFFFGCGGGQFPSSARTHSLIVCSPFVSLFFFFSLHIAPLFYGGEGETPTPTPFFIFYFIFLLCRGRH